MKIYAIHDRLIDFWMRPFAAPEDKEVMQGLSTQVNGENDVSPIKQAPHHYDLYRLGEVSDTGHITANREFICTLSSLIRGGPGTPERGPTPPLGSPQGSNSQTAV